MVAERSIWFPSWPVSSCRDGAVSCLLCCGLFFSFRLSRPGAFFDDVDFFEAPDLGGPMSLNIVADCGFWLGCLNFAGWLWWCIFTWYSARHPPIKIRFMSRWQVYLLSTTLIIFIVFRQVDIVKQVSHSN
jgi:hypothetical protein